MRVIYALLFLLLPATVSAQVPVTRTYAGSAAMNEFNMRFGGFTVTKYFKPPTVFTQFSNISSEGVIWYDSVNTKHWYGFNGVTQVDLSGGGSGGLSPTDSTYIIMNGGGGDSARFYTNYRADTSRANIYGAIANSAPDSTRYSTVYRNDTGNRNIRTKQYNDSVTTAALIGTKQAALGYTPENVANKVQDLNSPNSTTYISTAGLNTSLLPFLLRSDSGTIYSTIKRLRDTATAIRASFPAGTDTAGLSARIDQRVKYSDSLTIYATTKNVKDTAGQLRTTINTKLTSTDTASLSTRINLKLNSSDTVSLSNRINLKLNSTDTASLSNRINLKMNYTDTVGLSNRINLKLTATDTASLSNRINLKMGYADTAGLSNRINLKLNSSDTAGLSGRINLKQNTGNYITALTGDVTAAGPGSVAATLQTVNATPGTFGSGTVNQVLTIDSKGRVTTVTTVAISATGSASVVTAGDGLQVGTAGVTYTVAIAPVTTNTLTLTTHATTLTATTGHSQGFTTDNFVADTITLAGFGATAAGGGGFTSTVMLTVLQNATGGSQVYFRGQTFSSALGTGAQPGTNTAANGLSIYYLRWNDFANRVTIDYTTY